MLETDSLTQYLPLSKREWRRTLLAMEKGIDGPKGTPREEDITQSWHSHYRVLSSHSTAIAALSSWESYILGGRQTKRQSYSPPPLWPPLLIQRHSPLLLFQAWSSTMAEFDASSPAHTRMLPSSSGLWKIAFLVKSLHAEPALRVWTGRQEQTMSSAASVSWVQVSSITTHCKQLRFLSVGVKEKVMSTSQQTQTTQDIGSGKSQAYRHRCSSQSSPSLWKQIACSAFLGIAHNLIHYPKTVAFHLER